MNLLEPIYQLRARMRECVTESLRREKEEREIAVSGAMHIQAHLVTGWANALDMALEAVKEPQEVPLCAAVKMPDGYVIRGHRHTDCLGRASEIERYMVVPRPPITQGFLTSYGRFVDREKAMGLAKAAGLIARSVERDALYSEDLY